MSATYNESKVTNTWWSINRCNKKIYFPGQPHSFQGFFQTFPYLWSFSKLFKAWKTSILNSVTFQNFPGSVRTDIFRTPHKAYYTNRHSETDEYRKAHLDRFIVVTGRSEQLIAELANTPNSDLQQWLLRDVGRHGAVQLLHRVRVQVGCLLYQLDQAGYHVVSHVVARLHRQRVVSVELFLTFIIQGHIGSWKSERCNFSKCWPIFKILSL